MGRRAVAGGLLVAIVALGDARAAGEAAVPPRDDVDALVALLAARPGDALPDGASPTLRVARLLAAGEPKLRPLLADAWRIAATVPAAADRRDAVRRVVRFLYSVGVADAPGAWLVETDGTVRVRRVAEDGAAAPDRMAAGSTADVPVPFDEAVKGARLRAPPRPDAKRLLASLDTGGVPADERVAVAQSLGEQCAPSTPLTRELLRRVQADDSPTWTATALAWTGRPEAETPLRDRVRRLAGGASGDAFASACDALEHFGAAALVEEIGKLDGAARETALTSAGIDTATQVDAVALALADDAVERANIVAAACRRIVAAHGDPHASAATLTSLAPILAAHSEDGDALARAVLADAARRLFWPAARAPAAGEDLGPYPSVAVRLAAITEDMKDGGLAFSDERTPLFALVALPPRGPARPLRTSIGGLAGATPGGDGEPFRLTGEVIGRFLRLTLKNEDTIARAVDRVALRHAVATIVREDAYAGPAAGRGVRRLDVTLGVLRSAATPVDRLVAIQPGATFSWSVELRDEDRDVEQITVAFSDMLAVRGDAPAARLDRFAATRVK